MPSIEFKHKSVWENKFRSPTLAELKAAYPKPVQQLVDEAREALVTFGDYKEDLAWLGIPWRWSLVYRQPGEPLAAAYLVPQPVKPRLAVPVEMEFVLTAPTRKLSKFIREGLVHCPEVGGIRWASWELLAKNQIDEIIDFMTLRRQAALANA
jgi:hypothetical protein